MSDRLLFGVSITSIQKPYISIYNFVTTHPGTRFHTFFSLMNVECGDSEKSQQGYNNLSALLNTVNVFNISQKLNLTVVDTGPE